MELLWGMIELIKERGDWILQLTLWHLGLSFLAILMACLIGVFLGIFISDRPRLATVVIGICNVIYTIPSIALLGILIPFLGIGNKTAVVAFVIYGLMPIVRNTYTGLTSVDEEMIEVARGMGSTKRQILWRVKLPLSMPVIMAGIRNTVVMILSMAAIAAFIGADGLGVVIYRGISIYNTSMTLLGSILIALIAFLADFLLAKVEKKWKKSRGRN